MCWSGLSDFAGKIRTKKGLHSETNVPTSSVRSPFPFSVLGRRLSGGLVGAWRAHTSSILSGRRFSGGRWLQFNSTLSSFQRNSIRGETYTTSQYAIANIALFSLLNSKNNCCKHTYYKWIHIKQSRVLHSAVMRSHTRTHAHTHARTHAEMNHALHFVCVCPNFLNF